ncbi:MAG: hypothetical protein HRU20_20890 [Pseudomonadales bacterium]|nr:hypothetical protein [Pseudomonadales bacterium]
MKRSLIYSAIILSAYSSMAFSLDNRPMLKIVNEKEFTDPTSDRTCWQWAYGTANILQSGVNPFSGKAHYEQNTSSIFDLKPTNCQNIGGTDYKISKIYDGKPLNKYSDVAINEKISTNYLTVIESQKSLHISGNATTPMLSVAQSIDDTLTDDSATADAEASEGNTDGALSFGLSRASSNYKSKQQQKLTKTASVHKYELLWQTKMTDENNRQHLITDDNFNASFKRSVRSLLDEIESDSALQNYAYNLVSDSYTPQESDKRLNQNIYEFISNYGAYVLDEADIGWMMDRSYFFESTIEDKIIKKMVNRGIEAGAALPQGGGEISSADEDMFRDESTKDVYFESSSTICIGTTEKCDSESSNDNNRVAIHYNLLPIWDLPLENILQKDNSEKIGEAKAKKLKMAFWSYTSHAMNDARNMQAYCGDGGYVKHSDDNLNENKLPIWQCNYADQYSTNPAPYEPLDSKLPAAPKYDKDGVHATDYGSENQNCNSNSDGIKSYMKGLEYNRYIESWGDYDFYTLKLKCSAEGKDGSSSKTLSYKTNGFQSTPESVHMNKQVSYCEGPGNFVVALQAYRLETDDSTQRDAEHYLFRAYCSLDEGPLNDRATKDIPYETDLVRENNFEPNPTNYGSDDDWDETYAGEIVSCTDPDLGKANGVITGITFSKKRLEWGDEEFLTFKVDCSPVPLPFNQ